LSSNAVNVPIAIFEKHLQAGLLWLLFLFSPQLSAFSYQLVPCCGEHSKLPQDKTES